uniref:Uncharacterized protein n=1 Tax=Pristionchus pacificus TaxID=54126 RepID=A0A2A6BJY5_PRIPA|eukprot:PDM66222.1 hypothetical protein PRIPAC_45447 [Pristionchus pacificus]
MGMRALMGGGGTTRREYVGGKGEDSLEPSGRWWCVKLDSGKESWKKTLEWHRIAAKTGRYTKEKGRRKEKRVHHSRTAFCFSKRDEETRDFTATSEKLLKPLKIS